MNTKKKPSAGKKCGHSKGCGYSLIPLDTSKIRKELLNAFKCRKRALEKLEGELQRYYECDEPEFQKFMALRFGGDQTRQRELHERIHLAELRLEKLKYMAREEGMSIGKYCAFLEEKVTPEMDFWSLLDRELQDCQEEMRKLEEELERYYQDSDEENDGDSSADDEELEDADDVFDDCGSNGEADSRFEDELDSFLHEIFGDVFEEEEKVLPSDDKELKKLYRELCLRYHPDKMGLHDAKTKRLWLSIQEAYRNNDYAKLRAIRAGIELESGKAELCCSEICEMTEDVEYSIRMTRAELRERKQVPCWGFSSWNEKKRRRAESEIAAEMRMAREMLERQLSHAESEIERVRSSYIPKSGRKTKKERPREAVVRQPDLFSM